MLKKILCLVLAIVMVASVMVGCAPSEPTGTPSTPVNADVKDKFKGQEVIIYIRMMDSQDKWFRENIINKFQKEYGAKVTVKTFENETDLMNIIKLDEDKGTIGVIKSPQSSVFSYKLGDYTMRIEDVPNVNMDEIKAVYTATALDQVTDADGTWGLPRKAESMYAVYSKSAVADAVANWETKKDVIEAAFKAENGVGLPTGYTLEADVNEWDWYDVAVAGMYWGNTEINGKTQPRIAHRTKLYEGTTIEIMNKVFSMNGKPEDLLDPTSAPFVETMKWEAFSVKNKIYNETMWKEMWSGGGIWNAFASGDVYFAYMSQMDAFFIHGGSSPDMTGYLADPDDMGIALNPAGASLELKDGKPAVTGTHATTSNGWYWCIPKNAKNPELSLELIKFITNEENHSAEASTFGIMPVTNYVMDNLDTLVAEPWMREVFEVGAKQAEAGLYSVPLQSKWPEISAVYQQGWHDVALSGDTSKVEADLATLKTKVDPLLDK